LWLLVGVVVVQVLEAQQMAVVAVLVVIKQERHHSILRFLTQSPWVLVVLQVQMAQHLNWVF
jgi:hypothetical protein